MKEIQKKYLKCSLKRTQKTLNFLKKLNEIATTGVENDFVEEIE